MNNTKTTLRAVNGNNSGYGIIHQPSSNTARNSFDRTTGGVYAKPIQKKWYARIPFKVIEMACKKQIKELDLLVYCALLKHIVTVSFANHIEIKEDIYISNEDICTIVGKSLRPVNYAIARLIKADILSVIVDKSTSDGYKWSNRRKIYLKTSSY